MPKKEIPPHKLWVINVRIVFEGLWRELKNSIISTTANPLPKRLMGVILVGVFFVRSVRGSRQR
jgi:hypothetical protein